MIEHHVETVDVSESPFKLQEIITDGRTARVERESNKALYPLRTRIDRSSPPNVRTSPVNGPAQRNQGLYRIRDTCQCFKKSTSMRSSVS